MFATEGDVLTGGIRRKGIAALRNESKHRKVRDQIESEDSRTDATLCHGEGWESTVKIRAENRRFNGIARFGEFGCDVRLMRLKPSGCACVYLSSHIKAASGALERTPAPDLESI